MNSKDFKFIGLVAKNYVFADCDGKKIKFTKCRKDLIESFKLEQTDFINSWFKVSYFKTKPVNQHDTDADVFIISNMEIVKNNL